jgi:serine/threonine protein kinase
MQKMIEHAEFDIESKIWKNISDEAKDLIKKMLKIEPDERPSATEVLEH